MKKVILFLLTFGMIGFAHAGIFGAVEKSNKLIHYVITGNVASTSTILIDLSDTSGYPHKKTNSINISFLKIIVDKVDLATGSVKIGVVTRVDTTDGDVSFFADVSFTTTTVLYLESKLNITPSTIRTLVKSNSVQHFVTNDTLSSNTNFQTDVSLNTSAGGVAFPAIGDIVIHVTGRNTKAANFSFSVLYQGVRR